MILLKLFLVFLRVGFFAIGGAYSFLPLLEKELVENNQWLDKPEFSEVVGMAEIFPGAISGTNTFHDKERFRKKNLEKGNAYEEMKYCEYGKKI